MTIGEQRIDLERLGLSSGQARALELELVPESPVVGGETYPVRHQRVEARVEVSRTTAGFALRLRAEIAVTGPCARCLEPAELELGIDAREVEQADVEQSEAELRSPYVVDGLLDVKRWLDDALVLAMPDKVLCRIDCAGLCPVCGVSLNEVDPETHHHERPPDPRFAKLRELVDDE